MMAAKIRRILVALDASSHSFSALAAAAELAAELEAELLGLFVEDIELLKVAELPYERQIVSFSGVLRDLDKAGLEQELRLQAGRARRALEAAAKHSKVRWSFRVTRGAVVTEVLAAASVSDLITLGKTGWSRPGKRGLGATARTVLAQASGSVLLLERDIDLSHPLMVLFDSSQAVAGLDLAAAILHGKEDGLLVLIPGAASEDAERLQAAASERLKSLGVAKVRYRCLATLQGEQIAKLAQSEDGGVLILPGSSPLLKEAEFQNLLGRLELPVLVVR